MEFSRSEYWRGLLFPSPGDLPNPGTEPRSPTLQVDSLPAEPPGKARIYKELLPLNKKQTKVLEQTFLQRYANNQPAHERMLNITSH